MDSLARTLNFLNNKSVDKIPFHPIIMRFASKYAGVNYKDFCLDYKTKCNAMIKCAKDFSIDWVTVLSDPYVESEAYGMEFTYPENDLPIPKFHLIQDINDIDKLTILKPDNKSRMMNRVKEIEEYSRILKDNNFIVGWVEGPLAEYADLRGLSDACFDLYDDPEKVSKAADIIVENTITFITAQVKAGAHCIGIGDAACSQVGPSFYNDLFFKHEKTLVDHIHSLGAIAKLHICGNTSAILPQMIKTGADIVDVDHMAGSMKPFVHLLSENQVFSGNSDPVAIIQNGNVDSIQKSVIECYTETNKRCIVSAGCEITPDTSLDNFKIYQKSVDLLK